MPDLYSTGVDSIDELLGGGLQPGTLTVVRGATGVGKTQLGLSFCNAGMAQEGRRGFVIDMGSRGDSQQEVREQVLAHPYEADAVATMFLQTTPETELQQLIAAQTMEDDLTTNATTIILMGRIAGTERVERGVFVLKNRGTWCSDEIVRFTITAEGLRRV